jgi:hypothetical protein
MTLNPVWSIDIYVSEGLFGNIVESPAEIDGDVID